MSDTFKLGDKGEAVVEFGLKRVYCQPKPVPKNINHQLKFGDVVCPGFRSLGIPHLKIEVKTEFDFTGNFFFETHSNVHTNRAGWAITSPADELYYLFWDEAKGYRIPNFQHVKWHFDYYKDRFKEVDQKRHEQENLTRGRLVPIEWVIEAIEFDFTEIKQVIEQEAA